MDDRRCSTLIDVKRLWVQIVEGHFMLRHQSEDGTEMEQALPACGRQHVYNTTWAKPWLFVSIRAQLYSHVPLITLHCHFAIPQYPASASLSLLFVCGYVR